MQGAALAKKQQGIIQNWIKKKSVDTFVNIADDPAHGAAKRDLLKRLSDWMHQTYDYLPPAFAGPGEPPGRGWPVSL